jgi:Mn-dependent DtxR family transcriptional regulator
MSGLMGTNRVPSSNLSNLQQAIYVLKQLSGASGRPRLYPEFDNNGRSISKWLSFLQDMGWAEKDEYQMWIITEKGDVWLRNVEDALGTR